jgi:hypothetical protein
MARASTRNSADVIRAVAAVSALVLGACAAPGPDTVLLNGRIFTGNPARPWAEALAVRGDRIVSVGATADVTGQAGASTRRIDLGGRAVVPGFNDAFVTLAEPTSERARVLIADAIVRGVTSLQVFSPGPVAETVRVLRDARAPLRIRVSRMPEPDASGVNRDSRPYFPPQPGPQLDARGMGFILRGGDHARLQQAVGWAYGSEDPLAIRGLDAAIVEAYVAALEDRGAPEVWKVKRPRLVQPAALPANAVERLPRLGVVVVQMPREGAPLKSILNAGITLALGSDAAARGIDLARAATRPALGAEALTMAEAVTAGTRGAAYAESTDRDKGHLSIGALADLVILSGDPFSSGHQDMAPITSLLTMIGGRPIHDVLRP